MSWFKENLFNITLFVVISAIMTPAYFFKDNNQATFALKKRSYERCNKISTQFIKQRCYRQVWENYRDDYCPRVSPKDKVINCQNDMRARYKGILPKSKFPFKLLIYFLLEFVLGLYFFYLKKKWSHYY